MENPFRYSTAPADPQANPAAGGQKEGTWFVLFGKTQFKALISRHNTRCCSHHVPRPFPHPFPASKFGSNRKSGDDNEWNQDGGLEPGGGLLDGSGG
jgi:hypothetical protein